MYYARKLKTYRSQITTYLLAFLTLFITIAIIQYPKDTFESAILGLNLWWTVVFPSLLPFFILSEILMGLGVVHALGVLLEPLMRPIFNVPGIGAFALSMGLASGYPMDAVITCKFRKNNLCSKVEAERLLAFTNTADPLFMFGAVAVGMFAMPELGVSIALAHYGASLLIGILYRFYGRSRDEIPMKTENANARNIFIRTFTALYQARKENKSSFGVLLGDAVKSSMNTILLIGGFIILFSVFLRILSVVGVTAYLDGIFAGLLSLVGFHANLAQAMSIGFFEIDLGTLAASQAIAPLSEKVAVASAIIAWSGLSVHGQVASIVLEAGISMKPYIIARILHAVLSGALALLFLGPCKSIVNLFTLPVSSDIGSVNSLLYWFGRTEQMLYQAALILLILICLSITLHMAKVIYAGTRKDKRA